MWDVDVLKEEVVRVYRASDLEQLQICDRGEVAEGEPALLGWVMAVKDLFI